MKMRSIVLAACLLVAGCSPKPWATQMSHDWSPDNTQVEYLGFPSIAGYGKVENFANTPQEWQHNMAYRI